MSQLLDYQDKLLKAKDVIIQDRDNEITLKETAIRGLTGRLSLRHVLEDLEGEIKLKGGEKGSRREATWKVIFTTSYKGIASAIDPTGTLAIDAKLQSDWISAAQSLYKKNVFHYSQLRHG